MTRETGKFTEEKILKYITQIKITQGIEIATEEKILSFENLNITLDFLSKGQLKQTLDELLPKQEISGVLKLQNTNKAYRNFGKFINDNYQLLGISKKVIGGYKKPMEECWPLCEIGEFFSESDRKQSLILTYDTLFRYSETAKQLQIEDEVKKPKKSNFQIKIEFYNGLADNPEVIPEKVINYQKKLEEMPNNENFKIIYNSKPSEPPKPRENIPIMTEIIEPSIKDEKAETLSKRQENLPNTIKEFHSILIQSILEKENSEQEVQARKRSIESFLESKRKFLQKQASKKNNLKKL